ncbi:hypothetical protein TRVL_06146 [Trypanosoma vivax]|nr:hypothetical protein TRVL_06146 [Trypanosoma vivax]
MLRSEGADRFCLFVFRHAPLLGSCLVQQAALRSLVCCELQMQTTVSFHDSCVHCCCYALTKGLTPLRHETRTRWLGAAAVAFDVQFVRIIFFLSGHFDHSIITAQVALLDCTAPHCHPAMWPICVPWLSSCQFSSHHCSVHIASVSDATKGYLPGAGH